MVSVFLNKGRKLHTTHSWDFLRLERDGVVPADSLWNRSNFGADVIIGNLDTGMLHIWCCWYVLLTCFGCNVMVFLVKVFGRNRRVLVM